MKKLITITTLLSLLVIGSVAAGASEITGTLSSGVSGGGSTSGSIGGSVSGGSTIGGTVTGGGSSGGGGGGSGFAAPQGQVLGAATVADPGTYPSFPSTGRAR